MYFTNLANTLRHISSDEKAVFLSGCPGSGKTFAALQFCSEHKENLYFSFKNIDALLALQVFCDVHPEIFGGCLSWQNFFDCLKTYGTKKRLLVFFDHTGERNDKEDFYADLDAFLNEDEAYIFGTQQQQKSIKLIDGNMLADYMVKYGIGVESVKTFNIYKINSDYFKE